MNQLVDTTLNHIVLTLKQILQFDFTPPPHNSYHTCSGLTIGQPIRCAGLQAKHLVRGLASLAPWGVYWVNNLLGPYAPQS